MKLTAKQYLLRLIKHAEQQGFSLQGAESDGYEPLCDENATPEQIVEDLSGEEAGHIYFRSSYGQPAELFIVWDCDPTAEVDADTACGIVNDHTMNLNDVVSTVNAPLLAVIEEVQQ